ncbi:hypothetical protein MAPG_02834 [Magnaporthiopsis poae ATCC 64411]|uniref:Uncharacterized protein n=1 Tax=Magnaporthiopsis poae (strain ATCC 64411 / 73-15) TaxID=644358 RepID=A0A0C4DSF5_MAGP6|nr:hypothetical protein MAPG_02834 [Magnaporthiopsis poae ATCC 64411]
MDQGTESDTGRHKPREKKAPEPSTIKAVLVVREERACALRLPPPRLAQNSKMMWMWAVGCIFPNFMRATPGGEQGFRSWTAGRQAGPPFAGVKAPAPRHHAESTKEESTYPIRPEVITTSPKHCWVGRTQDAH